MHLPSHLVIGWFVGEGQGLARARDRRIVAIAGIAPDVDALAYVGAILAYGLDRDRAFREIWQPYHHHFTHGLGFVLLSGALAWWLARGGRGANPRSARGTAALAMLAATVHLFCDLVAGGPEWPIYPFWPLSDMSWSVAWSWRLGDWQNTTILFAALGATVAWARVAGHTPLEALSYRLDAWLVRTVREGRDGPPPASAGGRRRALGVRLAIYVALALLVVAVLAPLGFRLE